MEGKAVKYFKTIQVKKKVNRRGRGNSTTEIQTPVPKEIQEVGMFLDFGLGEVNGKIMTIALVKDTNGFVLKLPVEKIQFI